MNIHELKPFLLWCAVLNYGALLLWFGLFCAVHDGLYRVLARWFNLPVERFDALNFGGMALYKVGILLFNLVPLLALLLVS